jgi:hypothetical protein
MEGEWLKFTGWGAKGGRKWPPFLLSGGGKSADKTNKYPYSSYVSGAWIAFSDSLEGLSVLAFILLMR